VVDGDAPIRQIVGGSQADGHGCSGRSAGRLPRRARALTLTSVSRTVGVSNGRPLLDDGRVLDDVRTVVWCTGFRPDFRWIRLPVFGPEGYPNHRRGIVAGAPGLGFIGLRYQYRIGSSLIGGVREDAEYVVRQLASHDANADRASRATT
jgi:putative flavoprotein involved in K+ transport